MLIFVCQVVYIYPRGTVYAVDFLCHNQVQFSLHVFLHVTVNSNKLLVSFPARYRKNQVARVGALLS